MKNLLTKKTLILGAVTMALLMVGSSVTSLEAGFRLVPDNVSAQPHQVGGGACDATDPVPPALVQTGLVEYTEDTTGGAWQPWIVQPSDYPVAKAPDTASAQTVTEIAELQLIALNRTAEQIALAHKWGDGPATKAWTDLYLELIVVHAAKAGMRNPPRLSREMAILHTAMYDALVATWSAKYCYLRPAPSIIDPAILPVLPVAKLPTYPSEHAALAGVASVIFPTFFPLNEEPAGFDGLATEALNSRLYAGANYRSDLTAGYTLGRQVAQAVLDERANDGANAVSTRVRVEGDCNWKPTPGGFRLNPLEPQWGDVQPWSMTSGSQFRAPPPPACDSPEYLAQYRDLFEMSLKTTARQGSISDFWEAGQGTVTPPGMSLQIAEDKIAENGLSTLQAARVMSYVSVAVADAAIASWDSKFHYWYDRPVTAIRRLNWDTDAGLCAAGEDAVNATNPYGGCWLPRAATPPFPGYISGHSTFTGAGMWTLMGFFPQDTPEFRGYATEAALARFYGGIHFRADNDEGIETGIGIGTQLQDRMGNDGGPQPE